MGQIFEDDGAVVPVTFVVCEPNEVLQIKTAEKDNSAGVVLGSAPLKKPRKTKKFKTARQFSSENLPQKVGEKVSVAIFEGCESLIVTGVSKGKGFQGGVKRHNFRTARHTHGTKEGRHGSTGACASPGRTKPGLKMAGQMGGEKVTLRNRKIAQIFSDKNVVAIKGALPGAINSTLILKIKK